MSKIAATEDHAQHLRRLDIGKLELGKPLPGPIHSIRGRILVRGGRALTEDDLELIREHVSRGVYGGEDWPETSFCEEHAAPGVPRDHAGDHAADTSAPPRRSPPDGGGSAPGDLVPLALERLHVGQTLMHPIYSRGGVLLLAAGLEVTHRFLSRLRQQGVCEVHVSSLARTDAGFEEDPVDRARLIGELDNVVEHLRRADLTVGAQTVPRRDLPVQDLREEMARGREEYEQALDRVSEIGQDVHRGKVKSVAAASDVVNRFMNKLQLDSSLLPVIAKLQDVPGEYLFQHGLNVALLSMSAAARLGARPEILMEIGLAGLLQDVGMLQVSEEVRLAPRELTHEEWLEVSRHPLYSLDSLQKIEGLSDLTLLICYQIHERVDGSGYPRRRPGKLIHPYTRLVAAANAYVAISSHRPHRQAHSPYDAMVMLLREGRRDLWDREVLRGFLDGMSLFPIGTYVRLSTGMTARVLRANPGQHTRPVVVLLNQDGTESDSEVDLQRTEGVRVVQTLPGAP